jgi:membrane protein DedA with SNARE-associated domain
MPNFFDFVTSYRYLGIIVVLVLTGMGLPIPEEVPVVFAGWASASGVLEPWKAWLACIVGAILGDSVVYAIGYHFGHNLAKRHRLLARFLHAEREEYVEQLIQRHGLKVFFVSRFLVGIRAPVYLATGVLRVPFRRFLLADAVSATMVVSLFWWLGYRYAVQIENLLRWIAGAERTLTVAVIAGVTFVVIFLWRRNRKRWNRLQELLERRKQRHEVLPVEQPEEQTKTLQE